MKICAVIATRYRPPTLGPLLEVLKADGICAHLMVDRGDHRLNRMWNRGCDAARTHGAEYIAVLNDDIEMWPGTLAYLAEIFPFDRSRRQPWKKPLGLVYPDVYANWGPPPKWMQEPVHMTGPFRTGFCLMFPADMPVRFDERYHFDYGDVQFIEDVQAAGWDVGRVIGVRVKHEHAVYGVSPGYSTQKAGKEIAEISLKDRAIWLERHPA